MTEPIDSVEMPLPPGPETALVLIALGSNLGDRRSYLAAGLKGLEGLGRLVRTASVLETAPLGPHADQPFLNTAALLTTSLDPKSLLAALHAIERANGRSRAVHWGNHTLDLDMILWQSMAGEALILDEPTLRLPHPECLKREFVLVPAAEIAPDWRHPVTGRRLDEHAADIKKGSQ